MFLLLFKDCGSQINFAMNMANININVGNTVASMANTSANMASTAVNMVNSATGTDCHKQTDARTSLGPRRLQLALQGNAGRWQRSSLRD